MVLTFRSSRPEERVIIERNANGDKRVARAVSENSKTWNLTLEHPSGRHWNGTFHGDGATVNIALAQLLVDNENDFKSGTTYKSPQLKDPNIRVGLGGENIVSPPIRRDGRDQRPSFKRWE